MNRRSPMLLPSRDAPERPLSLRAAGEAGPLDGVLLRGVVVAADMSESDLVRQLAGVVVHAVEEDDQVPFSAPLFGDDWPATLPTRRGVAGEIVVDFAVEARELFTRLLAGRWYFHLSMGQLVSNVVQIRLAAAPVALAEPSDAVEQLSRAYDAARRGEWQRVATLLGSVAERATDPGRPHDFNLACAHALAGSARDARAALDEATAAHSAKLVGLLSRLSALPGPAESQTLLRQRAALLARLDAAAIDPDLAPLRTR